MRAPSEAVEAGGVMPSATATAQTGASTLMVRVWDPFVRIFHWSLVSLFIIAFITGDKFDRLHIGVGYAIIGLVALARGMGLPRIPPCAFRRFRPAPSGDPRLHA